VIDEAYLPATFSAATLLASPMSDEEFAAFCARYPDYLIETTAAGEIVIMPPNYPLGGARSGQVTRQLGNWNDARAAGIVIDSSGGFVLPNGARRSPDAAWVSNERLRTLGPMALERYWHFCPEFVVEVRSATDRLPQLRAKMREWVANGAVLAWLIDPERRAVEIYRPAEEPEVVIGAERIAAGQPVEGFTLELARIWDPLATF
jgi:Uma2 family endonuclease